MGLIYTIRENRRQNREERARSHSVAVDTNTENRSTLERQENGTLGIAGKLAVAGIAAIVTSAITDKITK